MQWQQDPEEYVRIQNQFVARLGRDPASSVAQEGFQTPSEAVWARYRVPAEDRRPEYEKDEHEKERRLLVIGKRLERGGFGEVTGELENDLLSKVYGLLAFSMAFTLAGLVIGYRLDPSLILLLFLGQISLIFMINAWREEEHLNLFLLYAFCFMTGLMLGPGIASLVDAGMQAVVFEAVGATAVITGCMFVIGRRIEQNLNAWGPFLFAALLGFVGLQIANLVFFNAPIDRLLLSFGGVVLFCTYLVYDVNRIRHLPNTMGNAILICLDVYLDIINLFVNLLQILIEVAGEGD